MALPKFINDRYEGINFERMRKYRVSRAVEQMKKDGLGCLVTWDAYDIRYISSVYVTVPMRWTETAAAILLRDGEYYVTEPHPGVWRDETPKDNPWLKGRGIPGRFGPGKQATTVAQCENEVKTVARLMAEHGVTNEPLGLDGCTSELLMQEAFKSAGIKVVDGKHTMFEARKIKNQDEVECVRIACANAEAAFADIQAAVRPGIKECDIVGIGMKRLYEEGADEVLEFVCASGERTSPLHVDFTDRMVRAGDTIIIDINGNSFNGYKTCYYRTFCCGKPTAEQEEIYEQCLSLLNDQLSVIKPGNSTEDIVAKWPRGDQVYHGHPPQYWGYNNWEEVGQLNSGHGIGLALHELPNLPSHRGAGPYGPFTKFEEGMVFAPTAGCAYRGWKEGPHIESDIVVTKNGYELLSEWPIDKITECWT